VPAATIEKKINEHPQNLLHEVKIEQKARETPLPKLAKYTAIHDANATRRRRKKTTSSRATIAGHPIIVTERSNTCKTTTREKHHQTDTSARHSHSMTYA
jgi:hypothetical protein